jgi:hypothetical protein
MRLLQFFPQKLLFFFLKKSKLDHAISVAFQTGEITMNKQPQKPQPAAPANKAPEKKQQPAAPQQKQKGK